MQRIILVAAVAVAKMLAIVYGGTTAVAIAAAAPITAVSSSNGYVALQQ